MIALNYAKQDLKQITNKLGQGHIDAIKAIIVDSNSPNELAAKLNQAPNSSAQFIMAHLVINVSEEMGKYRGGTPTLADQILDRQHSKVRQYKNKSYPLSEKQLLVIAKDAWGWVK